MNTVMAKLDPARILRILAVITFLMQSALGQGGDNQVTVRAGESIQQAIDLAQPGTTITVMPGIYAEQITIIKDDITIFGSGAVLTPPESPVENLCTGIAGNDTAAGICIAGTDVQLAEFVTEHRKVLSVGQYVKNTHVAGFSVSGFNGLNVAVVGADNTRVSDTVLRNGDRYGFLAAGSTNTYFHNNVVTSTDALRFIAVCNDNPSGVEVSNNYISGYGLGFCIQTPGSQFLHNNVENCCVDAFVDPTIQDVRLFYNHFGATNLLCATEWDGASGIILFGSINTVVQSNVIQDQSLGGMAAGIAVIDAIDFDPSSVASGNVVSGNVFLNNDFDIYVNTTGTGNIVGENQCTTPAELCSA